MKEKIFYFILGAIIFSSITAIAVTQINANQIVYTKNGTDTTVDAALNDLYTTANKEILNSMTVKVNAQSYGPRLGGSDFHLATSSIINNYRYFKIKSISLDSNSHIVGCDVYGWSGTQSTNIPLQLDTEYNIHDTTDGYNFGAVNTRVTSDTDGLRATCTVEIQLYNR